GSIWLVRHDGRARPGLRVERLPCLLVGRHTYRVVGEVVGHGLVIGAAAVPGHPDDTEPGLQVRGRRYGWGVRVVGDDCRDLVRELSPHSAVLGDGAHLPRPLLPGVVIRDGRGVVRVRRLRRLDPGRALDIGPVVDLVDADF